MGGTHDEGGGGGGLMYRYSPRRCPGYASPKAVLWDLLNWTFFSLLYLDAFSGSVACLAGI